MAKHLHERRKITFQEYGALLATRALLARNDLKFTPGRDCLIPGEHAFNMATKGRETECGSIGCIGGTMAMIMGAHIRLYVDNGCYTTKGHLYGTGEHHGACSKSLTNLFYPPGNYGNEWLWITPKIAVQAIDNWLKDGKPRWAALKKAAKRK